MEVKVKDFSIYIEKDKIANHLQIFLESPSFVTILSDDDRLAQAFLFAFAGLIPFEGSVIIDQTPLSKRTVYTKKISFVFHHQHQFLQEDTVRQHLSLKCKDTSLEKMDKIMAFYPIKEILDCKIQYLSASKKQLVTIIDAYLESPSLLLLEDPLFRMDDIDRNVAFQILKKLNKEKDTIIVHFTSNVEDILMGDTLYLFANGECINYGSVKDMLHHEKSFLKTGYDLPFMASLSHKLSYYNLVENPVLNEKEMIEILWKSK